MSIITQIMLTYLMLYCCNDKDFLFDCKSRICISYRFENDLLSLFSEARCDRKNVYEKRFTSRITQMSIRTIAGYLILRHGGQRFRCGLPYHLSSRQTAFTEFYCRTSSRESQLKVPKAVESRHSNPRIMHDKSTTGIAWCG